MMKVRWGFEVFSHPHFHGLMSSLESQESVWDAVTGNLFRRPFHFLIIFLSTFKVLKLCVQTSHHMKKQHVILATKFQTRYSRKPNKGTHQKGFQWELPCHFPLSHFSTSLPKCPETPKWDVKVWGVLGGGSSRPVLTWCWLTLMDVGVAWTDKQV